MHAYKVYTHAHRSIHHKHIQMHMQEDKFSHDHKRFTSHNQKYFKQLLLIVYSVKSIIIMEHKNGSKLFFDLFFLVLDIINKILLCIYLLLLFSLKFV